MNDTSRQELLAGDSAAAVPGPGGRHPAATRAIDQAPRFALIGVLIIVIAISEALYPGFLNLGNIKNLLWQIAPVGLVAIGMTFVLISGGFDLSVGGIYAFSGVLFALLSSHMTVTLAFILVLVIGAGCGICNGIIITLGGINAFITTLGTGSIFLGLTYIVEPDGSVQGTAPGFGYLGNSNWAGLPATVWILLICFLVAGLVLSQTVYGSSVYSTGGNLEAARLSGIRVNFIRSSAYVLTAVGACLGGMLLASQTGIGQVNVGTTLTLEAIAVVIIGGTSLSGGRGAMWRTFVGVLIIGSIYNLFSSLALNGSVQSLAEGGIVIAAVGMDNLARQRSAL